MRYLALALLLGCASDESLSPTVTSSTGGRAAATSGAGAADAGCPVSWRCCDPRGAARCPDGDPLHCEPGEHTAELGGCDLGAGGIGGSSSSAIGSSSTANSSADASTAVSSSSGGIGGAGGAPCTPCAAACCAVADVCCPGQFCCAPGCCGVLGCVPLCQ